MIHKTDCSGTWKTEPKECSHKSEKYKTKKSKLIEHSGPVSITKWGEKRIVTIISAITVMIPVCYNQKEACK
jgi:hypothetical protein